MWIGYLYVFQDKSLPPRSRPGPIGVVIAERAIAENREVVPAEGTDAARLDGRRIIETDCLGRIAATSASLHALIRHWPTPATHLHDKGESSGHQQHTRSWPRSSRRTSSVLNCRKPQRRSTSKNETASSAVIRRDHERPADSQCTTLPTTNRVPPLARPSDIDPHLPACASPSFFGVGCAQALVSCQPASHVVATGARRRSQLCVVAGVRPQPAKQPRSTRILCVASFLLPSGAREYLADRCVVAPQEL